jgi:type IV pilus assembly protein PilM
MFVNPFPNAFGLDIGDLSIKAVQLRNVSGRKRSPQYELVNTKSTRLPYGLIANGELQQPEKIRSYINHVLHDTKTDRSKRITSPWVVASIPDTQSFIKLITIPKPPTDIIHDDVVIEAQKHIPFEKEKYYLDWQIMHGNSEEGIETHVLIGAVSKTIADSYAYLIESLGLGVISLEIQSLALARSMITADKIYKDEARMILDLGAARSTCIVYDHDMIQFSNTIPYSGELLIATLAQTLKISPKNAKQAIHTHGLNMKGQDKRTWSIINMAVTQLVNHIQQRIDFYYSHFADVHTITHITMCGGGSNLPKLEDVLSHTLNIECAKGHPWKNLSAKQSINMSQETTLHYATTIGLALRAADNIFLHQDTI